MKIMSFVRQGRMDCGLVTDNGGIALFERHDVLGKRAPEKRLFWLLESNPEQRMQITEEMAAVQPLPAVRLCPCIFSITPTIQRLEETDAGSFGDDSAPVRVKIF